MHHSEDLWISRAVDRAASAEDWRGLAAIATTDPDVWRRLCATLREETLLAHELATLLPPPAPALPVAADAGAPRRGPRGVALVALFAAAALALAFWLGRTTSPSPATASTPAPTPAPTDNEELLSAYLAAGAADGNVLEQLPLHTLATRRLPDGGGLEVVFVRSLVERRRIDRGIAVAADEHGRPVPLPVDLASYIPPTNY
ncbi:MAG: hypothetical protein U1E73_10345 [Planctomycetota bacterium]